jgi:hypothetical protein
VTFVPSRYCVSLLPKFRSTVSANDMAGERCCCCIFSSNKRYIYIKVNVTVKEPKDQHTSVIHKQRSTWTEKKRVRFFHARRSFMRRCTYLDEHYQPAKLLISNFKARFILNNEIVYQSLSASLLLYLRHITQTTKANTSISTTSTFPNNIYIYIVYFIVKDHGHMSHEDKIR